MTFWNTWNKYYHQEYREHYLNLINTFNYDIWKCVSSFCWVLCVDNIQNLQHVTCISWRHNGKQQAEKLQKIIHIVSTNTYSEMLTLSGTLDVISFGEFMISPIYYIYIIYYWICQFYDYVHGLMTLACLPGLFAWTALSRTYFISWCRYLSLSAIKLVFISADISLRCACSLVVFTSSR